MKTKNNKLFLVSVLIAGLGWLLAGPATAATYSVIKNFIGSDGSGPFGTLTLSGGTLYGTTYNGGSSGLGTVFKVSTDGSGYTVLKHFTGSDGANPAFEGLTLSGSTLYGTTYNGGTSGAGTVFKIETDGTGHTVLKHFAGGSGGAGVNGGVALSGSTLYGAVNLGGTSGFGLVFKIETDGTGYTALKHFTGGSDGGQPVGGLTLSGSTLYGGAHNGGTSGFGVVFKIETDGTGYTVLKDFAGGSDGGQARSVKLSGSTLYGATAVGGSSGFGTVFRLETNGTGHTVLKNFAGSPSDGRNLYAGLTLSGNTLYGTTYYGGSSDGGTVFRINTNGSGYTVLKHFTGSDGSNLFAGLTLSGSTLYGAASLGGSSGNGTMFRMDDINANLPVSAKNGLVPTSPAGAKFNVFYVPAVNIAGDVAFKATLVSGFGGVVGSNNIAIYAGTPGAEALVVRSSDFAPDANGTPTATRFLNFSDPAYNNAGEIAFRGQLKIGIGSVGMTNDTGLWSSYGGTNHLVAREGDVAPDTGGAKFASFTSFALPDSGDVVFIGTLTAGTGSPAVGTTNKVGIWVYDSTPTLRKLTRTGDSTLVNNTNKTLKTLTFLPSVAYSPGQSRSFNADGGQLVYKATFTDGSTAILSASYP